MTSTIAQSPATLAFRGIAALLFGIIALAMPLTAFWALVVIFGAYALADGVSALISALTRRNPATSGRSVQFAAPAPFNPSPQTGSLPRELT